ncbi:MoaD/ThiS family protein [Maridesulfovibrio hydrothermalis]|uniref:MoaD/ThiS family protein n=1 Tax=Maridesulfovibrio hydrothermalis TaxID=191026 RepID=UPI00030C5EDF|nr:MoaD/ThiS family protein [Maridesulfovibrio hydrothermalis]
MYLSEGIFLEIPEGSSAGDLPACLGFEPEKVAMYFIGEARVEFDHPLTEGDVVKMFPPITGG